MTETALAVEIRESTGKGVARKLRAIGKIPAVLYGHGKDPVSLSLNPRELRDVLKSAGHNALIDLIGDATLAGRTVLVKDVQRDPVGGEYLHADLFEISADETINVSVAVHLIGTAVGVSMDGGLLDHALREIEVDCLPRAIPESFEVEVSELHLGDSIHVSDLVVPEGVTVRSQPGLPIVSIVAPAKEEEVVAEVPEEGEEGAEVAAEGDEPTEGAAPAADGGDKPSQE